MHSKVQPNPSSSLKTILTSVKAHLSAWDKISPSSNDWIPPSIRHYQANFDVEIRPQVVVVAVALSDHEGNIIATSSKRIPLLKLHLGRPVFHSFIDAILSPFKMTLC